MLLIGTLIVAVAVGAGLALLARAAFLPRMRAAERLAEIQSYGFSDGPAAVGADEEKLGLPRTIAAGLGEKLGGGGRRLEEVRKLLITAGIYRISPSTFMGYRVLAGLVMSVTLLWTTLGGGLWPPAAIGASAYMGFIGWMLPVFLLKARARRRLERIEVEMPELIDLLVVTLEAGLGLSAALQRSAGRMTGPLGDELALALREYELGLTIDQALRNLVNRCDAPATRSLIRAVTQSQSLGISISQIMRGLAEDLRKRRKQIVEERAHKAPIKILFPLAFLILPTIFIVVLYPAMVNVMKTLAGS